MSRKEEYIVKVTKALDEEIGLGYEDSKKLVENFFKNSLQELALIKEEVKEKNYPQLRKTLHKLKGSAANMRAIEISTLAKEGEEAALKADDDLLQKNIKLIEDYLK